MLRYGSVCSGIEAASIAWEPLGMTPAWFSEIEPFPSAVLAHHWPGVQNHGDMLALPASVAAGKIEAPDILVGGTPCQAFSVAGARRGLEDERGQLTIKYVELADAIDEQRRAAGQQPCVIVWENVPGVLSSKDNAFGSFLGLLAGESCALESPGRRWSNAGYVHGPQRSIAWRVLDAQYFGVAQRRRRVFVVASARKGFDPRAVLFESEGVRRDTPPSREAGEGVAGTLASRTSGGGFPGTYEACSGYVQPVEAEGWAVHGTQDPCVSRDKAFALGRNNGGENAIAIQNATRGASQNGLGVSDAGAPMYTLDTASQHGVADSASSHSLAVRRLTPVECERLQGFPDGHTLVEYRNKPAADGNRYKAIGNSMAVPCMAWIGERLMREANR